jgi:hypothetical protein
MNITIVLTFSYIDLFYQNIPVLRNSSIFRKVLCLLFCFSSICIHAQKAGIKGTVTDTSAKNMLHYAIIALIDRTDSTLITSSRSSREGIFLMEKIKPGAYTVMITYPDMADFLVDVTLKDTGALDMGKVVMTSRFHLLQEVIVQSAKAIRMKGDTLEFRADSFPVAAGANVEELLRRLPGIEVGRDGKITAQGEKVAKILVDGDEFFSDDPTLATQYLQAKSVDKVQVFDKKSDQVVFSGIDDGIRNKTINIKLKENSKNGLFGKLSAGTDAKDFYNEEGMINIFRGKEKISLFGIGSNTGTTGLSYQDRSQYFGNDGGIEDESGRVIGIDNDDRYYGSGLPTSFNSGAQYANKWNQNKQNINFNYRLNQITTDGWQTSNTSQLLPDSSIRKSSSRSNSASYSMQHKAAGYYEMVLDSFSTVKFSVMGQLQNNNSAGDSYSESMDGFGKFLNKSTQLNQTKGDNSSFSSSVLWQRRLKKKGRNVSVTLSQNYNHTESTRQTEALSFYYNPFSGSSVTDSLNQQQRNINHTTSLAARITYTEPLAEHLFLSAEYSWRQTGRDKDRNVMREGAGGKYDIPVDSLSNNYTFNVITHTPGLTLQYSPKKFTLSAGGKLGYTTLEQVNRDLSTVSTRNYINLFPQARADFSFSQTKRFSINYNGRTSQPTIDQLQPLRENSNPLYVTIGNPDLQPSFSHSINVNYYMFSLTGSSNLNFGLNWSQTMNSILSSQTIDQFNKTTSKYINRNGLPAMGMNVNYSRRLTKTGAKTTFNLGITTSAYKNGYFRLLNNTELKTDQLSFNVGTNLSLYKPKVLALYIWSGFNYSENHSDNNNIGTNYNWGHNHNVTATIFLPWKMELASDANMNFQPANSSFATSRNIIKWNASLQKKFLKNGQAQAKLAVFDILNQNTGYYRSAGGGYFSESTNNYIPRYALLSFTWNFTRTL